jgi:hypothetical protein
MFIFVKNIYLSWSVIYIYIYQEHSSILPPTGKIKSLFFVINLLHIHYWFYDFHCGPHVIAAAMMSAIYEENKDENGFLCMTYCGGEHLWNVFETSLTYVNVNRTCKRIRKMMEF